MVKNLGLYIQNLNSTELEDKLQLVIRKHRILSKYMLFFTILRNSRNEIIYSS